MEPGVERSKRRGVGRVRQTSRVEQRAFAFAAQREVPTRGVGPRHRGHGNVPGRRFSRTPLECRADKIFCPEPDGGGEVRRGRLVLAVVADQRLHRDGVFLRVAPAAVLARGNEPAHDRRDVGCRRAASDKTVQHERRGTDVRVPEPQEIRIVELLDVRRASFWKDCVAHPPPHFLNASACLSFRDERIVQIRQREDRHAIQVGVQPIDSGILVPAAIHERPDGKGFPGGIRRPPRFVRGRVLRERLLQIVVPASHHVRVHVISEGRGCLIHLQDIARKKRRGGQAGTWPEREPAGRTLELLQLDERFLRLASEQPRVDARQLERIAEIRCRREHEGSRRPLLHAPVRVLDDVPCAFAEADERR